MSKVFRFTEYGGPETQELVDVAKPSPGPGQLLVAVRAAGVNPADWKLRAGLLREFTSVTPPAVLGSEVAGVVERLGTGVEGFAVGDEVFGNPAGGGYAEYTLMTSEGTAHKPPAVSFAQAAVLPVAAATAYDGVEHLGLQAGATLLVIGVGGGVGVAVAQIARARGVHVIGTASPDKEDFVTSLGVTHIAYGQGVAERIRAVAPGGVDAVFDLVGGDALEAVAGLLVDGGALITAGDPVTAARYGGVMVRRTFSSQTLAALAFLVESGELDSHITETYPLDRAADALRTVEAGHTRGKVVIEIP